MSHTSTYAALCSLLTSETNHGVNLVAMHGGPASGKTGYGRALAADLAHAFAGDALWLDLGPHSLPATLLAQAERYLQMGPSGDADLKRRSAAVRRALAGRGRILAVLDDVVQAGVAAWAAAELLPERASALLLTRDHALSLDLDAVSVPVYDLYSAPSGNGAGRDAGDSGEFGRGGHAGWDRLPASYGALPADLQWRFRSLGAFASGALDISLVAAVWGDPEDVSEAALAGLASGGLLVTSPAANDAIYRAGRTTLSYAARLLDNSPDAATVRQRHAEAVLAAAIAAEEAYRTGGAEGAAASRHFVEIWPQVTAAWEHLLARDDPPARAACDALAGGAPHLFAAHIPSELRGSWLEHALRPAALPGRQRWEARHLAALAAVQRESGDLPQAVRTARRAVAIAAESSDAMAGALAAIQLGAALTGAGQGADAIEPLVRAIDMSRTAGDLRLEAETWRWLAKARTGLGQAGAAGECLAAVARCAGQLGDSYAELAARTELAREEAARPVGRAGVAAPAAEAYRRALLLAHAAGDEAAEAELAGELGDLCIDNSPEEGIRHYERALALSRSAGERVAADSLLVRLGKAYAGAGRLEDATRTFERVLAAETGDDRAVLAAHVGFSEVLAAKGDTAAAAMAAQTALPLAQRLADQAAELAILLRLGLAHLDAREFGPAASLLGDALPASSAWRRACPSAVNWGCGRSS